MSIAYPLKIFKCFFQDCGRGNRSLTCFIIALQIKSALFLTTIGILFYSDRPTRRGERKPLLRLTE